MAIGPAAYNVLQHAYEITQTWLKCLQSHGTLHEGIP